GVPGPGTTASLLAADSSVRYMASYAGYAWRNRIGASYTYMPMTVSTQMPAVSSSPATCSSTAKIRVDTVNGRTWPAMDLQPAAAAAQPGAPVFLYQEVMYWFAQSVAYPQAGRPRFWPPTTR